MSAIDTTFHWVRNPAAINGLPTTYVSKRGSDVSGDGTAQNPYASIAKATSVATAGTNIMLDDGEWEEERTANGKIFNFFGNSNSKIGVFHKENVYLGTYVGNAHFYYFALVKSITLQHYNTNFKANFHFCIVDDCSNAHAPNWNNGYCIATYCVMNKVYADGNSRSSHFEHCIILNSIIGRDSTTKANQFVKNSIIINSNVGTENYINNCNFTTSAIPSTAVNSINDATTKQTLADYFNYVHPNVLANPTTATIDDWLQCDFTAKAGSANIGAGDKGTTIGFNQGFTMYADHSANDVFKISNGATLQNIDWDSTLNGYTLVQKERVCQGATANKITLDSSASAEDDYYNNLFIGIVGGDGYGELFLITDYDGTTKTATIDGTWNTIPTTNSIYTISGTIFSAIKDLGKVIKVKRNWTFADNFTALTDGQWAEFMTHVGTNGKQFPTSCYSYEYSIDGVTFVQGQTADDLVSATNGDNKVTDNIYGDCSASYDEATAKNLIMRYIRVRVHIGFNI